MQNRAHAEDPHAQRFGEATWRPPREGEPYSYPFRTCSYCGSINPHDLLDALRAGAVLQASDWKYGWPHKFYVEGIPNPIAGQIVECGSSSKDGVTTPIMGAAPATTHCKFYSTHIKDCEPTELSALLAECQKQVGIEFVVENGTLSWRRVAP